MIKKNNRLHYDISTTKHSLQNTVQLNYNRHDSTNNIYEQFHGSAKFVKDFQQSRLHVSFHNKDFGQKSSEAIYV